MGEGTGMGPGPTPLELGRYPKFKPPEIYVPVANGPFRTNAPNGFLRPVEFNRKKLPRRVRKILDNLPQGIAIVGGFARGLYTAKIKKVGDLDLAAPFDKQVFEKVKGEGYAVVSDESMTRKRLSTFFYSAGYRAQHSEVFAFNMYDGGRHYSRRFLPKNIDSKRKIGELFIWNQESIVPRLFCWRMPTIDVFMAPNDNLESVLKEFDISLTQFAYLDGQLYASKLALEDSEAGQFRLLRNTQPGRVEKYAAKGYKEVENEYCEVEYGGEVTG